MTVAFLLLLLSIITYPIPSIRPLGQPIAMFFVAYIMLYVVAHGILKNGIIIQKNVLYSICGIVVAFVLSSLFAVDTSSLLDYGVNLLVFLCAVFTMNAISMSADEEVVEKSCKTIIAVITVASIMLAVYGTYGYLTGNIGNETSYFWWDEAKYWGLHYTDSTRNADIHYIAFGFIALLCIKGKKWWKYPCMCFLAACLLLSMSRGCWIAIIIVLLFYGSIYSANEKDTNLIIRNLKRVLIVISFLVLGYLILQNFGMIDYFQAKLFSIFEVESSVSNSNASRLAIIRVTLETAFTHPFGVGAENMSYYYSMAGLKYNHAENTYLNLLAEMGVLGMISYVSLIFIPLINILRAKKEIKYVGSNQRFVLLSCLYIAVTLLFNTETSNCHMWLIIASLWFIYGYLNRNEERFISDYN